MVSPFSPSASVELQNYLKRAESAVRSGDMSRAGAIGREASVRGLEHPNLLVLAAYAELGAGAVEKALALAQRARAIAPHNADVLQVTAQALARCGQQKASLSVYDAALRKQPGIAALRYNRACLLADMFETARARHDFERVLELEPSHIGAMARLAGIAVANGEIETARDNAERVLKRNPSEIAAIIVLGQIDLLERKYDSVIARMRPITGAQHSATNRAMAQGLIADALDAVGKTAEAFAAYSASNQILKESFAPIFEAPGTETALARAERIANDFNKTPQIGETGEATAPVRTHVFLLGFPRSGTTLLENVLASHPAIETMGERDGLVDAEREYLGSLDGLDRLRQITRAELARHREAYWSAMKEANATFDRDVFVDKMPLNSLLLPVIARLFPDAKILLAIRDPRDVVLSCFRRRFSMSAKMYPLLSLDDTARFYEAAMRICATTQKNFSMRFRVTRHEDLVADFERQVNAICEFFDVAYSDEMANFAERAKARFVNTPSATQISQGLNTQGIAQWRSYRDQMMPVLPILAPWVKEFGYAEE